MHRWDGYGLLFEELRIRDEQRMQFKSEGDEVEEMKTYICDPRKCDACSKTACQGLCFRTTQKEKRATGRRWFKYFWRAFKSEHMRGAKRWTSIS